MDSMRNYLSRYDDTVWPRGSQFSRFSRLTGDPRKLNPRNKKPKRTRARAMIGGVAIVVHTAAQLD